MNTVKNKNNLPIGFFDSGIGGLSVYSRFRQVLPSENTIYYGDLKNLPYGNKSRMQLIYFAREILNFYKSKKVKAVVIACNTSSAQAYEYIKNEYDFRIYPIIQCCANVIANSNYVKLGVFATEATVKSKVYTQELNKYKNIDVLEIPCKNWVNYVETNTINSEMAIENIKLLINNMKDFNPEKIILGCTHYPYLLSQLEKFLPADKFIDPANIFVDYIKNDLMNNFLLNKQNNIGNEEFFVSANPEAFITNSKLFYDVKSVYCI